METTFKSLLTIFAPYTPQGLSNHIAVRTNRKKDPHIIGKQYVLLCVYV
jgi:hypothetical protein